MVVKGKDFCRMVFELWKQIQPVVWKRNWIHAFLTGLPLAFMVVGSLPSILLAQASPQWVPGHILVQHRTGLSEEKFKQILEQSNGKAFGGRAIPNGLSIEDTIGGNVHIVKVPPQAEQAIVRALSKNPHIQFAEVDGLMKPSGFIPNDPLYPDQWHLERIEAPTAWSTTKGEDIVVAVLDTGINANHYDFQGQLVSGWNSVSSNSDISDIHGHGTGVAGTVGAALNNGLGVASVAGHSKVMPIRVTNRSDGLASWSDVAAALYWAADHGADVANISYSPIDSNTVTTAANYFRNTGGVVVVAAGSSGINPGYSENPSLITVSATTQSDVRCSCSNYGNYIDVAAPGHYIYSTHKNGGTAAYQGTSFASPVAAGVAALVMSANPDLTPNEVEQILEDSADPIGSSTYFGAGLVNAAQAVQMAGGNSGGSDTESPSVTITNPARDATVDGWVTVDVNASDNQGVSHVVLYAGGTQVGQDTTAPYQFSWDSTSVSDGMTTLIAYAYDAAENEGSSGSHPIEVDNIQDPVDTTPPTVSIQQPAPNSTVSGKVQVSVQATDNVGLQTINLYIDGNLKSSTDVSPLSYSWNTQKENDGIHTLRAVAVDDAGLSNEHQIQVVVGTSHSLSVTVSGSGTVTSSPSGINCSSGTCTADFAADSSVTLTASPSSGATWSGWGGACGGTALTCTVTLSADRSVTATFGTASASPPSGSVLLEEDFSSGSLAGWTVVDEGTTSDSSAWSASTGSLVQSSNILGTYAYYAQGLGWTDYQASVRIRSSDNDAVGVMFRYQDAQNYYRFSWNAQEAYRRLVKVVNGVVTVLAEDAVPYVKNQTYQVTVSADGPALAVWIDGSEVWAVSDASHTTGTVAMYSWANAGSYFDDVLVAALDGSSGTSHSLSVTVSGSGTVTSSPSGINCSSGTCTADFAADSSVTLTASPSSGATWSGWGGACGGTALTCTVTLSADRSVTATFGTASAPPPSGSVLLEEDFSSGSLAGWTVVDEGTTSDSSAWSASTGSLVQSSNILGTYAYYAQGLGWTDYQASVRIRSSDNDAVGVMFRYQDAQNYYRFSWNAQEAYRRLVKVVNGVVTVLAEDAVPYVKNQTYQVTVSADGPALAVWIDGSEVWAVSDASHTTGTVAMYSWANAGSYFDDVLVAALDGSSGTSHSLSVTVSGSGTVTSSPSGINCSSGTCTADFAADSSVTLTASPSSGATWSGWGGACGGTALTCTVTLSADRSVTATFGTASAPPPSGSVLLEEDFSSGSLAGWTVVDEGTTSDSSAWSASTGSLVQSSNILGTYAYYAQGLGWTDYQASVRIRSSDNDAVGVMFRYQDAQNYYRFSWNAQEAYRRLVKVVNGVVTVLAEDAVPYVKNQTYQVTVSADGPALAVWIDGSEVWAVSDASHTTGTVAMYSWANAGSYFDDVLVAALDGSSSSPPSGSVLLEEDFSSGSLAGWTVVDEGTTSDSSAWSASTGSLVQSSNILGTYAYYAQGLGWTDYQASVRIRSSDNDAVGVMFRYQDAQNYYRFSWNAQEAYRRLVKVVNGVVTVLAEDAVPYVKNQTYQVTVSADGPALAVWIDGSEVWAVSDASHTTGTVAMYSWANAGSYFDDVLVQALDAN